MQLGLDTGVSFARTLVAVRRTREDDGPIAAVTVGASNAARRGTALKRKGVSMVNLGKAGWKISEDTVAYMAKELSHCIVQDEILVLQCLDSNCFYVLEKSGTIAMPCKGRENQIRSKPVIPTLSSTLARFVGIQDYILAP
jgi:phosphohistidine swiveling domain-containing protein